jgi:hypothetical protein
MTTIDPSDPSRLVGAVLGGSFRLARLLGQGGMGAVYAAEGLQGQGVRAVKLLHPEFRKESSIVERFFAEAQTSARLTHPGIVRVDGAATAEDGTPYLVMELLEGQSLEKYVEPGKALPLAQVSFVLERLLDTLQYAHQSGVVHRDLKPENLFVVPLPGGAGSAIKIVDFGIAKVMDAAGGMGSKTRTGMMLGTPGYMSPEQMRNAKLSDPRSDLWSVGVMTYEMVTGVDPFPADDPFAKLMKVLSSDPPPLRTVRPDLTPLEPFFARALARDPAQRFQSAAEMSAAWRSAVASMQAVAAPPPAPPAGAGGTVAIPQHNAPPTVGPQHAPPTQGPRGGHPPAPGAGGTAQIAAPYPVVAPTKPSAGVPQSLQHAPPGPAGPAQAGARPHDRPEIVTQLSQLRPMGAPTPVPTLQPDQVRVVPPPALPPSRGLQLKVSWIVAFAVTCVVLGVVIGLLIAYL